MLTQPSPALRAVALAARLALAVAASSTSACRERTPPEDVRVDGRPLLTPGLAAALAATEAAPAALAAWAADAGAGAVIVLDLARVGTGAGVDHVLLREVRAAAPAVTLLAGGGVRDPADLVRLADDGCDGALVASALHDGRLGPRTAPSA